MSTEVWRKRCEEEWGLRGAPMPDSVDWRSVYEAKPFGRNLLKNPSPYALGQDGQTGGDPSEVPPRKALCIPGFIEGDFSDWTTSTESVPSDMSRVPKGAVVCAVPKYSWFTMEQVVDLRAEGLWEELLDNFQPQIVVQDRLRQKRPKTPFMLPSFCMEMARRYEESRLHEFIYQLHVKLLASDKATLIAEHRLTPTEDRGAYSCNHKWKEVSHVFSGYGPGVRYVHFVHRLKNQFLHEFYTTASSGSSVIVRPVRSS